MTKDSICGFIKSKSLLVDRMNAFGLEEVKEKEVNGPLNILFVPKVDFSLEEDQVGQIYQGVAASVLNVMDLIRSFDLKEVTFLLTRLHGCDRSYSIDYYNKLINAYSTLTDFLLLPLRDQSVDLALYGAVAQEVEFLTSSWRMPDCVRLEAAYKKFVAEGQKQAESLFPQNGLRVNLLVNFDAREASVYREDFLEQYNAGYISAIEYGQSLATIAEREFLRPVDAVIEFADGVSVLSEESTQEKFTDRFCLDLSVVRPFRSLQLYSSTVPFHMATSAQLELIISRTALYHQAVLANLKDPKFIRFEY